jgi:putative PIG3 family NAD(P)H quinone oxidoreductase
LDSLHKKWTITMEQAVQDAMRAITIENSGSAYRLKVDDVPRPTAGRGEVLIEVVAAGVNRADLAQAAGRYPPPKGASPILGLEVAGRIVERGADVEGFPIGDSVCALLAGGGYAEYCAAPQGSLLPVPQDMEIVHAAALPETCFTVWTNLIDSAHLAPGESVLVHGGASGIGTTAIQLCAALGHTIFVTAGSPEKCAACEKLGAQRAIDYRSEDFVGAIEESTGGRGVDVILDMIGGDYVERNFRALSHGGRLVNIAFQNGMTAEVNFGPMMLKRLTFMATMLRARPVEEKGRIRDALRSEVWPLIDAGRIRPVIDSMFPLERAQAAHERMAASRHIGKILLTL